MKTKFLISIFISILALSTSCSDDDNDDNPSPISTGENSFSPETLTATVGETITFIVGSGHTATRVSQATWDANGTTPNGGFNFSQGTYTYVLTNQDVGTIYYVCQFHVTMGMKGKIIVNPKSSNGY